MANINKYNNDKKLSDNLKLDNIEEKSEKIKNALLANNATIKCPMCRDAMYISIQDIIYDKKMGDIKNSIDTIKDLFKTINIDQMIELFIIFYKNIIKIADREYNIQTTGNTMMYDIYTNNNYPQLDANEFLTFLIDTVTILYKICIKKPSTLSIQTIKKIYTLTNDGTLYIKKKEDDDIDDRLSLSLYNANSISIQELIDNYFNMEIMDSSEFVNFHNDTNLITGDKINLNKDNFKNQGNIVILCKFPKFLNINIKRAGYMGGGVPIKWDTPITINETILINEKPYKLLSFIEQLGGSGSGHYICRSKNPRDDKYYTLNDLSLNTSIMPLYALSQNRNVYQVVYELADAGADDTGAADTGENDYEKNKKFFLEEIKKDEKCKLALRTPLFTSSSGKKKKKKPKKKPKKKKKQKKKKRKRN